MSLLDYAEMLFRSRRIGLFEEAVRTAVDAHTRVLDLGTGLGTYAMFAARAGARSVTAVDRHRVIHVARAIAARNGLDDRIDFVRGRAPEGLTGEFDLVIFEDYPTTFMEGSTHRLLSAVVKRHLAADGRLMPGRFRMTVAAVIGPRRAMTTVAPPDGERPFGLDWCDLRARLVDTGQKVFLDPAELLPGWAPGRPVPTLPVPAAADLAVEGMWTATGDPIVGLALWFDLELGADTWISNRPGPDREPWGQWVVPLDPPLTPPRGAEVVGRVWRETGPDGAPGWMAWSCSSDGDTRRGHQFGGLPLTIEDLDPGRR